MAFGKLLIKQYKPYLFVLPALIFYIIFVFVPIAETFKLSFFEWNGASPVKTYIGLENFLNLLEDDVFMISLKNTVIWTIIAVAFPLLIGLVLSNILVTGKIKFSAVFEVAYFMPNVLSVVVIGIIWSWIFLPDNGILTQMVKMIGLETVRTDWLGNSNLVLYCLLLAASWGYFGFCMVVFISSLKSIDKSYFEAATIDGANAFQTFIKITIPSMKNSINFMLLYTIISSLKVFDIVNVMTKGGPYHSSEVIATYLYTQVFQLNNVGYGSSIAIALTVIVMVFSVIYMMISEKNSKGGV